MCDVSCLSTPLFSYIEKKDESSLRAILLRVGFYFFVMPLKKENSTPSMFSDSQMRRSGVFPLKKQTSTTWLMLIQCGGAFPFVFIFSPLRRESRADVTLADDGRSRSPYKGCIQ